MTLADIKKRERLEDSAENTYATVLQAATNYWQEIVKRYPKSPYAGPALYELATANILKGKFKAAKFDIIKLAVDYPNCPQTPKGLYELGTAMLEESLYKDGVYILDQLVKRYPKNLISGDAYLALIDLQIEEFYDFPKARTYARMGVIWVESLKLNPIKIRLDMQKQSKAAKPKPGDSWSNQPPTDSTLELCYSIYIRSGLIEYLAENKKESSASFLAAKKYDQGTGWSDRKPSTLLQRLIDVAIGLRKVITPKDLSQYFTNDKQMFLTRLADMYMLIMEPEKACGLYEKLLEEKDKLGNLDLGLESYVLMRYAQSLEFQRKPEEARVYIKMLYRKKYAKYPWACNGILLAGIWAYNRTQDYTQAIPYWKYVIRRFPDTEYAQMALFYYGAAFQDAKKKRVALKAYQLYAKKYPKTYWSQRVQREILTIQRELKGN